MAQILVRNIDDTVVKRLKLRAKLKGFSLEQEVRGILNVAAQIDRTEIAARARLIRAQQKPHRTSAADLIREDRNR